MIQKKLSEAEEKIEELHKTQEQKALIIQNTLQAQYNAMQLLQHLSLPNTPPMVLPTESSCGLKREAPDDYDEQPKRKK